jgi:hypothetical protein
VTLCTLFPSSKDSDRRAFLLHPKSSLECTLI